jgi:ATP-dependent helicase/nuclease subunit A
VPAAYRRQLALYARLLAAVWPGRSICAAILWTAEGRLDAVPQAALDAALADIAPAKSAVA